MVNSFLRIVQINRFDINGGAEKISWDLFKKYQDLGYDSWLLVGKRESNDVKVLEIPNDACCSKWAKFWINVCKLLAPYEKNVRGVWRLNKFLPYYVGQPVRWRDIHNGREDFNFNGSRYVLNMLPKQPDIVHCHNLHGGYFDLRLLPSLSHQVPVLLTLHDAWLLSGNCAHSFECERWKTGCGRCPDITIYPGIKRDATAYNWRRKRAIFAGCRLFVATPSKWLMRKVELSVLATAVVESRVIPNGVDLSVFCPKDKGKIRAELGIPQEANVLLFAANGIREHPFKDFQTLRNAVLMAAESLKGQCVLFIALGEDASEERIGNVVVRFVPYQKSPENVANYLRAADIYLHAAKADTFPNTVIEALACGTPVIATAVGGIPEQIKDDETGFLTLPGDYAAMAGRIIQLLKDEGKRQLMGRRAAEDAKVRFDLNRQVTDYITWYQEIVSTQQLTKPGNI